MWCTLVFGEVGGKRAKVIQSVTDGVSSLRPSLTDSRLHFCLVFACLPTSLVFFFFFFWPWRGASIYYTNCSEKHNTFKFQSSYQGRTWPRKLISRNEGNEGFVRRGQVRWETPTHCSWGMCVKGGSHLLQESEKGLAPDCTSGLIQHSNVRRS